MGRAFAPAAPHQLGHRERLRERFLAGGADAMPDYELLELVLFAAIPRRDVKPLAKSLIDRMGGFAEVLSAPRARLLEVDGIGETVVTQLKIIEAAALRLARKQVLNRPAQFMAGADRLLHGGDGAQRARGIPGAVP
jgi:DNA repair protein RadC